MPLRYSQWEMGNGDINDEGKKLQQRIPSLIRY